MDVTKGEIVLGFVELGEEVVEQIQVRVAVCWEGIGEMDDWALALQVLAAGSHGNSLSILDTKVEEEDSEVASWANSITVVDAVDTEGNVDNIQKVVGVIPSESFDP